MKQLELNIKKIAFLAEQNEEENIDFRIFLKGQDIKRIDSIVHRLNKEITFQIDCRECGNCCKSLRPCVTSSEIKTLALTDSIPVSEFVEKFVETDNIDETYYLKDTPCKYLTGKICSIYTKRPKDCKSYPHTHKSGFITRTLSMIESYGICPIVYNLMEQLKEESGYMPPWQSRR